MEPVVVCFEDETLRRPELRKPVAQFRGHVCGVTDVQDLWYRHTGSPGLYRATAESSRIDIHVT